MGKDVDPTAMRMSTLRPGEELEHDGISPLVEGHLLHVDDGFDIAIYTRNGVSWVAELREDRATLIEGTIWFRFHSSPLRNRREDGVAVLDSATALTPRALAQIDRLHRQANRPARHTLLPAIVNAVRRWIGLGSSRERTSTARRAQHLG